MTRPWWPKFTRKISSSFTMSGKEGEDQRNNSLWIPPKNASALEFGYSPYPTKPPNSMFEFRVSLVCQCSTTKLVLHSEDLSLSSNNGYGPTISVGNHKPDWPWLWLWETLAIQKMLWEPCWVVVSIFFYFYSYLGKWFNLTISFQSTSHIPWKKVPQAQQKTSTQDLQFYTHRKISTYLFG